MSTVLLILILATQLGCNGKKNAFNLEFNKINSISWMNNKSKVKIDLSKECLIEQPSQIPCIKKSIRDWVLRVNNIKWQDNKKNSVALSKFEPNFIRLAGENYKRSIVAYRIDQKWSYLIVKDHEASKSGFILTSDYDFLFTNKNEFRRKKLPANNIKSMSYMGKSVDNKVAQALLKDLKIIGYAHNGAVTEGLQKKLNLGLYLNNNIPGVIKYTNGDQAYSFSLSRPKEVADTAYLWFNNEGEVLEVRLIWSKWRALFKK